MKCGMKFKAAIKIDCNLFVLVSVYLNWMNKKRHRFIMSVPTAIALPFQWMIDAIGNNFLSFKAFHGNNSFKLHYIEKITASFHSLLYFLIFKLNVGTVKIASMFIILPVINMVILIRNNNHNNIFHLFFIMKC